ncbi:hypothetical protein GH714_035425 [Hevea brasiliensis]|uniref:CCHC-type domain-containing protein n=1 Tax=Hevea brasiliensis TaxID=3981 RepID=A0A6A6N786_HEVBR|nr:hypothetical protein GH714_035425 [Hevea brasiliensis]
MNNHLSSRIVMVSEQRAEPESTFVLINASLPEARAYDYWTTLTIDDITLHVLHGLPFEYNGIADALRTLDTSVSFDELYEKLVDYDAYLQCKSISVSSPVTVNAVSRANNSSATRTNKNPRPSNGQGQSTGSNHAPQSGNQCSNNRQNTNRVICQLCDKPGHVVKQCRKLQAIFPWLGNQPSSSLPMFLGQILLLPTVQLTG